MDRGTNDLAPADGSVVDLATRDADDAPTELARSQVRDRALVAAGLSFTISDPREPDAPLIYVNPAFERTTGYGAAEAVGRNCRFLQGPGTDPTAVQRIRETVAAGEHAVVTLLNYRKDGSAFWNELSLSPVRDQAGTLTHYVGIQADVTDRVTIEQERARHLAAEQVARANAEAAQRRLALLAEATTLLAATLDVEESLQRLTRLVVPVLADWCTVHLLGDDGEPGRTVAAHHDPDRQQLLEEVERGSWGSLREGSATRSVLAGGAAVLVREVTPELLEERIGDPAMVKAFQRLGCRSAIVVPLRARRQVLGALTLMCDGSGRTFDEDDLSMAADLARRAALTMDNARLYSREHDVAEALQRSLLPVLPTIDGLDVAARYLPGSTAAQVGGDWYDLFRLPPQERRTGVDLERRSRVRSEVGIAIGDVMGHDLTAAAAMGQLRSVLRSYAWQGERPALVLDHLDQLVQGLDMAQLATTFYARLSLPTAGQPGAMIFSNAGHLPPVLREPDGSARLLEGAQSVLVGAALGITRDDATARMTSGAMMVLYTDGLVEERGLDPDVGLERLRAAVEALPTDLPAEAVCDALLRALDGHAREDDVALLVVRLL